LKQLRSKRLKSVQHYEISLEGVDEMGVGLEETALHLINSAIFIDYSMYHAELK
jgi:hypothetical protein